MVDILTQYLKIRCTFLNAIGINIVIEGLHLPKGILGAQKIAGQVHSRWGTYGGVLVDNLILSAMLAWEWHTWLLLVKILEWDVRNSGTIDDSHLLIF